MFSQKDMAFAFGYPAISGDLDEMVPLSSQEMMETEGERGFFVTFHLGSILYAANCRPDRICAMGRFNRIIAGMSLYTKQLCI